ncbi:hypothetical protein NAC44_17540 [Allorhizobium sp. BGMRC 0089]|uniref:hypothetical protein n=1 Tax=Allorhizobium sonneratiae TaxID=2934936 RepID=UPI0020337EDD|nr:hypothetical protein [Allorhizobium sonneratiae]MCM2294133.1 hypothetical protein [Allorhizobium sonneratiae]
MKLPDDGAQILAGSQTCPFAILRYGAAALIYQAHREFTADFIRGLVVTRGQGLSEEIKARVRAVSREKCETVFRPEMRKKQSVRAFHCFRETMKCSNAANEADIARARTVADVTACLKVGDLVDENMFCWRPSSEGSPFDVIALAPRSMNRSSRCRIIPTSNFSSTANGAMRWRAKRSR